MKKILFSLLAIIFSCCGTNPNSEDCKLVVLNLLYKNLSNHYLVLNSIQQINTVEGVDPKTGSNYYDVHTKITLEIVKECVYYPKLGFMIILIEDNYFEHDISQVGAKYSFEKTFRFYKTGNGWLGEDGFTY